jgi:diadenosine tetraphosphate (Ap4A) HIT family hydrolase
MSSRDSWPSPGRPKFSRASGRSAASHDYGYGKRITGFAPLSESCRQPGQKAQASVGSKIRRGVIRAARLHGMANMNDQQSSGSACQFCALPEERIISQTAHGFLVRDGFPVSPGHSLIISRRHVGSFFDLTEAERNDLTALLNAAKVAADEEFHPCAYTVGINDGIAAGQTVPHLHIHLIPRFDGDVPDPRGGVRWVIPNRAKYWR